MDERIPAVGPDQVVDRRHALGVGEEEPLERARELALDPVERDDRVVIDGVLERASVFGAVAFAEVDRETLVEPAWREVVRVLDRSVEHEVDELVRYNAMDLGIIRAARGDLGKERPDLGQRLTTDVLLRAWIERAVERLLIGVDVEVDRLLFGHAEQL